MRYYFWSVVFLVCSVFNAAHAATFMRDIDSRLDFLSGRLRQQIVIQSSGIMPLKLYFEYFNVLPVENRTISGRWSLSFNDVLRQEGDVLKYCSPKGKNIIFTNEGNGVWASYPNKNKTLLSKNNSFELIDKDGKRLIFGVLLKNPSNRFKYAFIEKIIQPGKPDIIIKRDSKGRVHHVTSNNNNIYTIIYDKDKISKIVDANNQDIAIFVYGARGLLSRVYFSSIPLSKYFEFIYDDQNRIISKLRPNGGITTYKYQNNTKFVTVLTDANGHSITLKRNNNYVQVTKRDGNQYKYLLDLKCNQPIKINLGSGKKAKKNFDESGKLIMEETACNSCDDAGRLNGDLKKYTYNKNGRISKIEYFKDGNKSGEESFCYNDRGIRVLWNDFDGRVLKYNDIGQITSINYPDGTSKKNIYNNYNLKTEIMRNGSIVNYTYSDSGMTIITKHKNTKNVLMCNIRYDLMGRISKIDNGNIKNIFSYNEQGYVIQKKSYLINVGNKNQTYEKSKLLSLDSFLCDEFGNTIRYSSTIHGNLFYEYDCQYNQINVNRSMIASK